MNFLSKELVRGTGHFTDVRAVETSFDSISITNGELDHTFSAEKGVMVRELYNGCWYSSTASGIAINRIRDAIGRKGGNFRSDVKIADAPAVEKEIELSDSRREPSAEEKISFLRWIDSRIHDVKDLKSYSIAYSAFFHRKEIVNSEGSSVSEAALKPEFSISMIVRAGNRNYTLEDGTAIIGVLDRNFREKIEGLCSDMVAKANRLKNATHLKKVRTEVIADPAMVGLILHETLGHLAEGDLVVSGSPLSSVLNRKIAPDFITIMDTGESKFKGGAVGTIGVDDEAVLPSDVTIVENGILRGFMNSRESAATLGMPLTGNGRTENYAETPQVRMRNTIMLPGNSRIGEMVSSIKDGYLIDTPMDGEVDTDGFFQFTAGGVKHIVNGEIEGYCFPTSISGSIFDFLAGITEISRDFNYGIGAGWCIKTGDPVKVDGGGPFVKAYAALG